MLRTLVMVLVALLVIAPSASARSDRRGRPGSGEAHRVDAKRAKRRAAVKSSGHAKAKRKRRTKAKLKAKRPERRAKAKRRRRVSRARARARARAKRRRARRASKVKRITRSRIGTTLLLNLDNAPFPARGAPYRDSTVLVFVPRYFRVDQSRRLDILLHFHGHRATAASAIRRFQLDKQLYDSRQNAILVVPQGPVRAADSRGGKLERRGGLVRFLGELRRTLQRRRARYALRGVVPSGYLRVGKLVVSAHSGGFRVTAKVLEHGGFPVSEVYLFDALYGFRKVFRDWLLGTRGRKRRRRRKLVSYMQDKPVVANNVWLMRALKKARYPYHEERREGTLSRRTLSHATAIFVRTRATHSGLQWRNNALRDCLFASTLRRYLRSNWYRKAKGPRPIERRKRQSRRRRRAAH